MGSGLGTLQVYRNSLKMSEVAWEIYERLPKALRYDMGAQFLRVLDSIGANIAEGYGRYHYKDKIKFYYNARGSLWESKHWLYLPKQRKLIEVELYDMFMQLINITGIQFNNFIKSTGSLANG